MPCVQFDLQAVALSEQRAVLRREVVHDGIETGPESGAIDTGPRQGFLFDELFEIRGDLQSAALGQLSHGLFPGRANSGLTRKGPRSVRGGIQAFAEATAAAPAFATCAS